MPQTEKLIGTISEINARPGDVVRLVYIGDAYVPCAQDGKTADQMLGVVGDDEVVFAGRDPIPTSSDGVFYVLVEKHISNMTEDEKAAELEEARARIAELERMLKASGAGPDDSQFYQHIKRGTVYRLLGAGRLQTAVALEDDAELLAYRDVEDGSIWFRQPTEFFDGRFEKI